MTTRSIPAADMLVAHEKAAQEIGELRRKGIPCHLEEHADRGSHRVEVVRDSLSDVRTKESAGEEEQ